MDSNSIHDSNKNYWDTNADEWFGVTALTTYGAQFVTIIVHLCYIIQAGVL